MRTLHPLCRAHGDLFSKKLRDESTQGHRFDRLVQQGKAMVVGFPDAACISMRDFPPKALQARADNGAGPSAKHLSDWTMFGSAAGCNVSRFYDDATNVQCRRRYPAIEEEAVGP